jgi:hypothetical protein
MKFSRRVEESGNVHYGLDFGDVLKLTWSKVAVWGLHMGFGITHLNHRLPDSDTPAVCDSFSISIHHFDLWLRTGRDREWTEAVM